MDHHPALVDGSFAHLPTGRLPHRDDPRTLRLANYVDLDVVLPQIPPSADWTSKVPLWPMYGNDRLGDCTVAAAGHMIQAWSYNAGHAKTPTPTAIDQMYWLTGNPPAKKGVPGGPTDVGRVELDVLKYWRKSGVGTVAATRDHLTAFAAVDPRNHDLVKAAIWLFGGVYTGIGLPITAQRQRVWDYVGGPGSDPWSWGGHAVPYTGFDDNGVTIVTWGATIPATWGFHDHYTDEAWALVSNDWFKRTTHVTVNGFDEQALLADLAHVGRIQP